jgi:hypothetical protein
MTRRSDAIFYRMRRMPVLCVVALSAILLVGCGGGGSQAEQEHSRHSAKLALHSQGDSGVSGVVSFEDISGGVIVKLHLHGLPKPDTFYLAHIHPGTCAQGENHYHGEHGGRPPRRSSGRSLRLSLTPMVTGRAPRRLRAPPSSSCSLGSPST